MLDRNIEEYWIDIIDYEGCYQISNLGNVKSLDRIVDKYHHVKEKLLCPTLTNKGYYSVMLSKNGIPKRFEVHRLMGLSFFGIDTICVNHKDGDTKNNNLINLEPCTFSENLNHAVDVLNIHSRARNVIVNDIHTNETYRFNSMRKAEMFFNQPRYWMKAQKKKYGSIFIIDNYKFEIKEHIYGI